MTKNIPLNEIVDNPFQPRTSFDDEALRSLADEIKAEGYWGTTLQGRRKNGHIELVFGHRRLRALRLLKVPAVTVELVDLTDGQMALRSLEENLQREGLTDLEKADAVKRVVEVTRAERKAAGKSEQGAMTEVAERLGLQPNWVSRLCQISSMLEKEREPVASGFVTAQTALAAKEFGGDAYIKTLAKQGRRAKRDGDVPKPTHMTVAAMKRVVKEAPEPVREKLKEAIVTGDVVTPKEAEMRARKMAATHTRRQKEPPPDLKVVIVGWTHRIEDWEKELRDVAPYMDYVEEVPAIAVKFRAALESFIVTAKKLL